MWPDHLALCECTLPTAAENVALDELLLQQVEAGELPPLLRLWECPVPAVAIGRSQRVDTEVHRDVCRADGVAIVRRSTGGGAVVIGPGCTCFTIVVPLVPELKRLGVVAATTALLSRIVEPVKERLGAPIEVSGAGDLSVGGRKFSGSAQRWGRSTLLHHSTWLREVSYEALERYLRHPSREPGYRQQRVHRDFVTSLPVEPASLRSILATAWNAAPLALADAVLQSANELAQAKFAREEWTFER